MSDTIFSVGTLSMEIASPYNFLWWSDVSSRCSCSSCAWPWFLQLPSFCTFSVLFCLRFFLHCTMVPVYQLAPSVPSSDFLNPLLCIITTKLVLQTVQSCCFLWCRSTSSLSVQIGSCLLDLGKQSSFEKKHPAVKYSDSQQDKFTLNLKINFVT